MENKKNCPYCGEEIMADAKKCRHCGEWLNETANPVKSNSHGFMPDAKSTEKKSSKLWIVICISCVVLVGVLFAVFSNHGNSSKEVIEEPMDCLLASVISSTENGAAFDAPSLISLNSLDLTEAKQRITKSGWTLAGKIEVEDGSIREFYEKNYDDSFRILVNTSSKTDPIVFQTESKEIFDSWSKSLEQLGYAFRGGENRTIICEPQSSKSLPVIGIYRNELLMEVYNAKTDKMEYMPMPDGSCMYELSIVQAEETE